MVEAGVLAFGKVGEGVGGGEEEVRAVGAVVRVDPGARLVFEGTDINTGNNCGVFGGN